MSIIETWIRTSTAAARLEAQGQPAAQLYTTRSLAPLTFLSALPYDQLTAPSVFDRRSRARDSAYIDQPLVATLEPGDIVDLDNLGSHIADHPPDDPTCRRIRQIPTRSSRS